MRLAREQGLLSKASLNKFQKFALVYWLYMDRRQKLDDAHADLERMTYNLDESRWTQIYLPEMPGIPDDLGQGIPVERFGEPEEVDVTDINDLDAYFESLEKPRRVTAADLPSDDRGWV